jgi:hypothetical protein
LRLLREPITSVGKSGRLRVGDRRASGSLAPRAKRGGGSRPRKRRVAKSASAQAEPDSSSRSTNSSISPDGA